jgi:hypothetical protein
VNRTVKMAAPLQTESTLPHPRCLHQCAYHFCMLEGNCLRMRVYLSQCVHCLQPRACVASASGSFTANVSARVCVRALHLCWSQRIAAVRTAGRLP